MEILKVENDRITVSDEVRKWLGSRTELLALIEGDALILKHIDLPPLENLVKDDQQSVPLGEIVEEVKAYRQENR